MRIARFIILALVISALGLITFSCDEKPTGPAPSVRFEDFVHFDTASYYLLRIRFDENSSQNKYLPHEPVMSWEASFGEPFTDVDGDGVFTPGVDLFIISTGADNQDLNRNSLYDGPSPEEWSKGIPFDDINGNGTLDFDFGYSSNFYKPGLPYCDINKNGKYDIKLEYSFAMRKMMIESSGDGASSIISYDRPLDDEKIHYSFTSDSNVTYTIRAVQTVATPLRFILEESGLRLFVASFRNNLPKLLDTGEIVQGMIDSVLLNPDSEDDNPSVYTRSILLNQDFEIFGQTL